MSQVRYHMLGPLVPGEGLRPVLALALEEGVTPRPVVLVWAPPDVAEDAAMLAKLRRETDRAVVFEHPHILRVHGLVTLEGRVARVTEFADGEPLRRVLELGKQLPPPYAALVVADAAMGVHYAHVAGNDDGTPFVHGDLRPDTLMVSFNGVVKVTGYGALSVAPRENGGRRVRNRRLYSAPEQLMGGREASSTMTDVFLLGLLLHECLSGRKPFQDSIDPDKAILSRPLPPLPEEIPLAYNEVIRRATAKRAKERYPSALAFREAVVAVAGELPDATAFAAHVAKLMPAEGEARANRRKTIQMAIAEATRHPVPTASVSAPMPASVSAPAAPVVPASAAVVKPAPVVPVAAPPVASVPPPGVGASPVASVPPPVASAPSPVASAPSPVASAPPPAAMPQAPAPAPARSRRFSGSIIAALGTLLFASAVGAVWSIRKYPEMLEIPDAGEPDASVVMEIVAPIPMAPVDAGVADSGVRAPVKPPVVAPPPVAPITTMVQLFVTPDVSVSIENRPLGHSPVSFPLPPGTHIITLTDNTKGIHTSKSITVRATPEPVTFRIQLALGSAVIQAPTGARLILDGRDLGVAPDSGRIEQDLYEGEHRLQVIHNGVPLEKNFVIQGGQRLPVDGNPEATGDEELP